MKEACILDRLFSFVAPVTDLRHNKRRLRLITNLTRPVSAMVSSSELIDMRLVPLSVSFLGIRKNRYLSRLSSGVRVWWMGRLSS